MTSPFDFASLARSPEPTLRPPPAEEIGFRIRLELGQTEPPVWRRLELPGTLTLPQVHDVIQAAMGWTGSHLHRFRTGEEYRSPFFVTSFDVDEGEEGVLEEGVRLDQLMAAVGDKMWYEYDFGDGWDHVLTVEEVLPKAPETIRCLDGRLACPPEDCGGIWGYEQLAAWVRSGHDDALLPDSFENARQGRDWLPLDWHPDHFDVDEANAALSVASAEPVVVSGELGILHQQLLQQHNGSLRAVLDRPLLNGPTDVSDEDAERLTEPYRILLEMIGDGVTLTPARYLPPKLVEEFAVRVGITTWWIGKANREDLTPPVAAIRQTAQALGLLSVRKGRLSPTAAATRCRQDPRALWQHIVGRLPLGKQGFDRQAGWLTLAVVGSGAPPEGWHREISDVLFALGWRTGANGRPPAQNSTLDVLHQLTGAGRTSRRPVKGNEGPVAATARAALRPR